MSSKTFLRGSIGFALIAVFVFGLYWMTGNRHRDAASAAPLPQGPSLAASGSLSGVAKPRAAANGPHNTDVADIEICGIGKVARKVDDFGAMDYVSDLAKPAMRRWIAALRNSDDYRARASGILLTTLFDDRHAEQQSAQNARDELVAMAVGSADPAVYAIALHDCEITAAESSSTCNQLSLSGWAKLDPDNAVPWLLAASHARDSKDVAAEASAFEQASEAHKSDSYSFSLMQFAAPELPADATPLERWSMSISMIGIEAAFAGPLGNTASRHCSKDALQDKGVAQQCQALAALWTDRPETVLDLMLGTSLGKSLGWPAQRVDELTQRTQAYMQIMTDATPSERGELWTCKGVERGNAYTAKLIQRGEIGAVQELLENSGQTVAELARRHTETMEKFLRAAQEQARDQPPP